jgi:hypothetical protein
MKIIQSLWSKPFLEEKRALRNDKFLLMGWTLSLLQLRQFCSQIELVTDKYGKKLLIDHLKLPYDSVVVSLDSLNDYPANLWAVGKLFTYQQQTNAFLHVDGDIFIWQEFPGNLNQSSLIALHDESDFAASYLYSRRMSEITEQLQFIPSCLAGQTRFSSINAGILGGSNIPFFKSLCQNAFDFINRNLSKLESSQIEGFNCVIEQLLFAHLAKSRGEHIELYLPAESFQLYSLPSALSAFSPITHARSDKRAENPLIDEIVYLFLYNKYPEYYKRVSDTLQYLRADNGPIFDKKRTDTSGCKESRQQILDRFKILSVDSNSLCQTRLALAKGVQLHTSYTDRMFAPDLSKTYIDFQQVLRHYATGACLTYQTLDHQDKKIPLDFLQALILTQFSSHTETLESVKRAILNFLRIQTHETKEMLLRLYLLTSFDSLYKETEGRIISFIMDCIGSGVLAPFQGQLSKASTKV